MTILVIPCDPARRAKSAPASAAVIPSVITRKPAWEAGRDPPGITGIRNNAKSCGVSRAASCVIPLFRLFPDPQTRTRSGIAGNNDAIAAPAAPIPAGRRPPTTRRPQPERHRTGPPAAVNSAHDAPEADGNRPLYRDQPPTSSHTKSNHSYSYLRPREQRRSGTPTPPIPI